MDQSTYFTDIKIHCADDVVLYFSKNILSWYSSDFVNSLSSVTVDSKSSIVKITFALMFNNTEELSIDNVDDVMKLTRELAITRLDHYCINIIIVQIETNVIFVINSYSHIPEVAEAIKKYLLEIGELNVPLGDLDVVKFIGLRPTMSQAFYIYVNIENKLEFALNYIEILPEYNMCDIKKFSKDLYKMNLLIEDSNRDLYNKTIELLLSIRCKKN